MASSGPRALCVDLHRRIAEAELGSTAATRALTALIGTEADTTEVERRLNGELDTLLVLRWQLTDLLLLAAAGDIPPAALPLTDREG